VRAIRALQQSMVFLQWAPARLSVIILFHLQVAKIVRQFEATLAALTVKKMSLTQHLKFGAIERLERLCATTSQTRTGEINARWEKTTIIWIDQNKTNGHLDPPYSHKLIKIGAHRETNGELNNSYFVVS
jgi:hypothetical protein